MPPSHGMLLPPFSLPAVNREGTVSLYDYKPRRSLVLAFLPRLLPHIAFLNAATRHYDEYREANAELLVICREVDASTAANFPFPVLVDASGDLQRKSQAFPDSAIAFIADRWGEVYGKVPLEPERALGDEAEVRKWAQFVDIQCAECFPPEWPAA